ncbi:amidase [Mycolicibacterium fluoranthenivorans]|uniref:Amidase n=1 Tax=Mycolicibacterium fluoranthenivorans TaxID=258505 RepID=A0A7G8PHP3_9MYCO|nr:amidase [Mycolicibacterium fluoranthenivorans]QNJ93859.1 amidase [Mycolicibacterium fluoranthenivorans]
MSFEELTISDLHDGLRSGTITSVALTLWYLDRIAESALNAVVSVNPKALAEAAAADAEFAAGGLTGPLHGVPVLIKDQAETKGIPTSFGSQLFADYLPDRDATVVQRLRQAGAIILAKTTMCDFAAGWFSSSSRSGHTSNAYATNRDSGGSSAGSGSGVAANLGLVGVGEDTGGSIRIPASFNNLFGLRVTTGLISRVGFSPLVHFQDTPGPMARTTVDLAVLLETMVGYDAQDPFTVVAATAPRAPYADAVTHPETLLSMRVGVLESGFGSDDNARSAPVNVVVRAAINELAGRGATLVPELRIAELGAAIANTSVYVKQSKADVTAFLAGRPGPVHRFEDIYQKNAFHPENDLFHGIMTGPDDPDADPENLRLRLNQQHFQRRVLALFADNDVDVIVYPTVQVVPPTHEELAIGLYTASTFPTNTVIASQAGLPALSMPVGLTADGLPIGLEVLGVPFSEHVLLRFAAAWEAATRPRRAPTDAHA